MELRSQLLNSGVSEMTADHLLAVLLPAASAIERERGSIEPELLALIVTAADAYRRRLVRR